MTDAASPPPAWSGIGALAEGVCDALPVIPLTERRRLRDHIADPVANDRLVAQHELFRLVELRHPPAPVERDALRIAYWNIERCKYGPASARLLGRVGADVALLGEMDFGCARSGQAHTTRDLADALELGYAYAVEYIELGLGDERERSWHAGQENAVGYYGNAMLSGVALQRPAIATIDDSGIWLDEPAPRIGRQMSLLATVMLGGSPITVVSAHFDSDVPRHRAANMEALLGAIERYAPGRPVVIGGDFNTKTIDGKHRDVTALKLRLLAAEPHRFLRPEPCEPLFAIAAAAGYDWHACNVVATTARQRPDGQPSPPFFRNDFFFTRGVVASDPALVPAVDEAGIAISDHELLAVTIRLP